MTARKVPATVAGAVALAPRKTKEAAIQVAALLSQALKIAMDEGSVGWVTAWLDAREELEGYGYTVELRQELEGLKAARADFGATYPVAFPADLSILEQMKVEEFFRELRAPRAPRAPNPAAPAAGPETPMVQTVEELLNYCRGFNLEEFRQVLLWMDGHGWGELPFGPTDRLKEKVADLLETEKELTSQVASLRGAAMVAKTERGVLEAKVQDLGSALRLLTTAMDGAPMDGETEEKALFMITHWEEIPLEALQWIVRVVRGEEPPFTDDHLETVRLLWESGEMIAAVLGASILRDGPHQVALLKRLDTLRGKTDTLFREAGLL